MLKTLKYYICLLGFALSATLDIDNIYDNLLECYKALVTHGFFPRKELKLVRAWISDLKNLPTKFQSHQSKRLGL